jgi:hypothetical protein
MSARTRLFVPLGCLVAGAALVVFNAGAHTLPISYLRIQPEADYLHLELTFNAFEISFISELDDNKDGELDATELKAHGQVLADRVASALKVSVGGKPIAAETDGMDPDVTGHHVRVRAHYKVDARRLPVTVESELNAITSSSHLIQVTYSAEGRQRFAQLDMQNRKVTFQPFAVAAHHPLPVKVVKVRRVAFGAVLLLAMLLVVVTAAATMLLLRKPPSPDKQKARGAMPGLGTNEPTD